MQKEDHTEDLMVIWGSAAVTLLMIFSALVLSSVQAALLAALFAWIFGFAGGVYIGAKG